MFYPCSPRDRTPFIQAENRHIEEEFIMSAKVQSKYDHVVGVISDTHGLLRPEAVAVLKETDLIIHAGDIDNPYVLEALRAIAPVVAVRGNMDQGSWARDLPRAEVVEVGEVSMYMLHDICELNLEPTAAGFSAVISGHTHRPSVGESNGALFLNPGSAGPQRSNHPVSVAIINVRGRSLTPRLIEL